MRNTYLQEQKLLARNDLRLASSADQHPSAAVYPLVTPLELEVIGAIRKHGEITKGSLILSTLYSRSKINGCIQSLLKKKFIKMAGPGDYTGGRR